jgi:A/G-specific adenine glycosylase
MAQQTQVRRVEPAWSAFMAAFPTPQACAGASTADVLRAWAGLGYNRRAVALHRAARIIVLEHGGAVPSMVATLEGLPGVGSYTARAVAAIAFGQPVAPVDVNIRRFTERFLGLAGAAPRRLQAQADMLLDPADPGGWTHAAMDLGASVCVARQPRCPACPVRRWCVSQSGVSQASARQSVSQASARQSVRSSATARHDAVERVPFERTSRWLRGRIVSALRDVERDAWAPVPARVGGHAAPAVQEAVTAMVGEGLIEQRSDGAIRLPTSGS